MNYVLYGRRRHEVTALRRSELKKSWGVWGDTPQPPEAHTLLGPEAGSRLLRRPCNL